MLSPGWFKYICETPQDIPAAAMPTLRPEISSGIGRPLSELFPDFGCALPKTTAAFEKYWSIPVLACDYFNGVWLKSLVVQQENANVFFQLTIKEAPVDGPLFDEEHAMLPLRWRQLYRFFESFSITPESRQLSVWRNTPLSFVARMPLKEYVEEIGARESIRREFEKKLGSTALYCWLWADAGDALFIDEARCDGNVYHVRADRLQDVVLVSDPENVLDTYLSHLLMGGRPSGFDFRKAL